MVSFPGIDAAVDEAHRRLVEGHHHVVITGRPTAGKTTTLARLRERVRAESKRTVWIAAPHADDGGPIALASAAAQVGDGSLAETVKRIEVRWAEKVRRVLAAATSAPTRTILFIDEPPIRDALGPTPSVFAMRATELARALFAAPELDVVFTVALGEVPTVATATVNVEARSNASQVLDRARWNGLGKFAEQVQRLGSGLDRYTPLELRLLVALAAAGLEPALAVAQGYNPRRLVEALLDKLGCSQTLRGVLGRLAVFRTSFRDALLERVGADSLDEDSRRIVRDALLYGDPGRRNLHPLIVRVATDQEWLTADETSEAHRVAAAYHREELDEASAAQDAELALRHEMEMAHHLTEAGDLTAEAHCFFVEQLDALGRSLSERRRYGDAVRVYERALEHDPEDAYAHHYLAYNLDIRGIDSARVDCEYGRAAAIQPQHAWYQGRWICFLATRGRLVEAMQRWEHAISDLPRERDEERLYEELHCQLAALLLHRGRLDFAEEVLNDVPPRLQSRVRGYTALRRLLGRLREAEANQVVFPPQIALADRWKGPHLLGDTDTPARSWIPGRVHSVDDHAVRVRVAERNPETGETKYGWLDIGQNDLRAWRASAIRKVSAGTFVELIELADGSRRLLDYPRAIVPDEELPRLLMRPDRYIRHAAP